MLHLCNALPGYPRWLPLGILLLLMFTWAASAAPAQAPGSRITLDLPAGFEPSRSFNGFMNPTIGASIILLEVPASAYPEMAKGLTPQVLSARGIEKAEADTLPRGGDYLYVTAEQTSPNGPYAKFLMLFREGAVTALVSVSAPKQAVENGRLQRKELEEMLASAHVLPAADATKKPYSLGYFGPFQDTGAFIGQTYFYSTDGAVPPPVDASNAPPTLTVSCLIGNQRIDDPVAAARAGLAALMPNRELNQIETQTLDVAGLHGVEQTVPPSSDAGNGTGVYQAFLVGNDGGYCRILGTAPADQWSALQPEFRKIAESFSPHP